MIRPTIVAAVVLPSSAAPADDSPIRGLLVAKDRAPNASRVVRRITNANETVGFGTALIEISGTAALEVRMSVPYLRVAAVMAPLVLILVPPWRGSNRSS